MNSKAVEAFADKLKSVWLRGYHDGFNGKPCDIEAVRVMGRASLLGEVYMHGYEAGKEDAADKGKWTDVQDLMNEEESET